MKITEVTSSANALYKQWCELSTAKGIRKHSEFILSGEKLIKEFLKNPGDFKIKNEIICEGLTPLTTRSIYKLNKTLFNEIDSLGTHFNLLILETPDLIAFTAANKAQGLELICPLGDPGNLGAIIRSAVAFGVQKMILTQEAANPFHPKCVKASAGAVLKINLYKGPSVKELCELIPCVGLDMKGIEVSKYPWPQNLYLLVGEEGPGITGLKLKERIMIHTPEVESLNATVAASIAFYEYAKHK